MASASPRRLDLLAQIAVVPDQVIPADLDETPQIKESPRVYARRMAEEKAQAVARDHTGVFVLGADTVVAMGRRILPKTETHDQACDCLKALSGRRHRVYGGIALCTPDGRVISRAVETTVHFRRLEPAHIETYIQSGEWQGVAGGYAIQGYADAFVKYIRGSYSNIVGLSLYDTMNILSGAGYGTAKK